MGVPEGKEREKRGESLFKEITAENFPKLGEDMDSHVHEFTELGDKSNSKLTSFSII